MKMTVGLQNGADLEDSTEVLMDLEAETPEECALLKEMYSTKFLSSVSGDGSTGKLSLNKR